MFKVSLYVLPIPYHEVLVHIVLVPFLVAPSIDVFLPRCNPMMQVMHGFNTLLCVGMYFQAVFLFLFLHLFSLKFCSHTSEIYSLYFTITA